MTGRVVSVGDLPHHGPATVDLPVPGVALAVGAHPDDIEFGCGATLAKWAAAGCRIHHVVLTDGSKGAWDAGRDRATLIAERQEEQRQAARILGGGEVSFLGYVDGELGSGIDGRRAVSDAIRSVRPDVVLGHDPWRRYRLHPDHRHAGWLVVDGLVAARDPLFFPESGLGPHRPSALLLWEADEPNHVEDALSTAAVKIEALMAHRSQHQSTMGIDDSQTLNGADEFAGKVRAQLATHGAIAGLEAGEAFHLLTDL